MEGDGVDFIPCMQDLLADLDRLVAEEEQQDGEPEQQRVLAPRREEAPSPLAQWSSSEAPALSCSVPGGSLGSAAAERTRIARFGRSDVVHCPVAMADAIRAREEAAAFEKRRAMERVQAETEEAERQRRKCEALREAEERRRMAAEEAGERERRALRFASLHEEAMRRRSQRESEWRLRQAERAKCEARETRRRERLERTAERQRRRVRREVARVNWMAENGYVLGPGGWTKLDWMASCDDKPPAFTPSQSTSDEDDASQAEDEQPGYEESALDEAVFSEDTGVVDQQPARRDQAVEQIIPSLDDLLMSIDGHLREEWTSSTASSSTVAPPLETMLEVIKEDIRRDELRAEDTQVKEAFCKIGEVSCARGDHQDIAALRLAQAHRPDVDWEKAIVSESPLKPFNDFDEAKQEGNTLEERMARSASINAKLQVARNRLSLVRWQPTEKRGNRGRPVPPQQTKLQPSAGVQVD